MNVSARSLAAMGTRSPYRRAWCLAGCGGAGEQAGKMTSFSTTESSNTKAELFALPADQMSHIQVVPVDRDR